MNYELLAIGNRNLTNPYLSSVAKLPALGLYLDRWSWIYGQGLEGNDIEC